MSKKRIVIKELSKGDFDLYTQIDCQMRACSLNGLSDEVISARTDCIIETFRKVEDKKALIDILGYGVACKEGNDPTAENQDKVLNLISSYYEKTEGDEASM